MQESPKRSSESDAPDAKRVKTSDECPYAPSDARNARPYGPYIVPHGFVCTIFGKHIKSTNCRIDGDDNVYSGDRNTYFGDNLRVTGNNNIVIGDNCNISGDFNEYAGIGNIDTGNENIHVSSVLTVCYAPLLVTGNVNIDTREVYSGHSTDYQGLAHRAHALR
jgi:hypothetical protein